MVGEDCGGDENERTHSRKPLRESLSQKSIEGLKKSAEIRNDERREERREELFRKGLSLIARFEENGTLKSTFDTSSSDDDFF